MIAKATAEKSALINSSYDGSCLQEHRALAVHDKQISGCGMIVWFRECLETTEVLRTNPANVHVILSLDLNLLLLPSCMRGRKTCSPHALDAGEEDFETFFAELSQDWVAVSSRCGVRPLRPIQN